MREFASNGSGYGDKKDDEYNELSSYFGLLLDSTQLIAAYKDKNRKYHILTEKEYEENSVLWAFGSKTAKMGSKPRISAYTTGI